MHKQTYTHKHTQTHALTHTNKRRHPSTENQAHTSTHPQAHTHTHARTHKHTHSKKQMHQHTEGPESFHQPHKMSWSISQLRGRKMERTQGTVKKWRRRKTHHAEKCVSVSIATRRQPQQPGAPGVIKQRVGGAGRGRPHQRSLLEKWMRKKERQWGREKGRKRKCREHTLRVQLDRLIRSCSVEHCRENSPRRFAASDLLLNTLQTFTSCCGQSINR